MLHRQLRFIQGSSTSPPDTLAHCYTPICTTGPSPCVYKGDAQDLRKGREATRAAGATETDSPKHRAPLRNTRPPRRPRAHSFSREACNPYCKHPRCKII
jgi:hypothetical protein